MSEGPFHALNLGRSLGDRPSAVTENRRRFAEAARYDANALVEAHQVHGAAVRVIDPGEDPAASSQKPADALIGRDGVTVGIRVADCVPILIADPKTGWVAAVHAGWRGIVAGVVQETFRALYRLGASPADCCAAIGPHIEACHFEVGEDVASQIQAAAAGATVVFEDSGSLRVSLEAAVRAQILDAGLSADRIDRIAGCTFAEQDRFFSYRRDSGTTGRHLAVIQSREAS